MCYNFLYSLVDTKEMDFYFFLAAQIYRAGILVKGNERAKSTSECQTIKIE